MGVVEIDIEEFARRHALGVRLVDVREPDEYTGGHVSGAVSVPLATVADRAGDIGPGDGPLYLICQAGGRSRRAAEHLASAGFDVVNVDGGTGGWIASGRDVVIGDEPA
ncbi:MAG: rhodanese-like domain-containing protein [Desertimonas sp.]